MKKILLLSVVSAISFNVAHAENTFTYNGQKISNITSSNTYNGKTLSNKEDASYNGNKVSHSDNGVYLNGQKIGTGPTYSRGGKRGTIVGNFLKRIMGIKK